MLSCSSRKKKQSRTRNQEDTGPRNNCADVRQRFTLNVYIFGLLLFSRGNQYILTCVDCFTRWPEATSFADITTDPEARSFIKNMGVTGWCPSQPFFRPWLVFVTRQFRTTGPPPGVCRTRQKEDSRLVWWLRERTVCAPKVCALNVCSRDSEVFSTLSQETD